MANIAASDVTIVVQNARRLGDHRVSNRCSVAFGDGALTYPSGGIPITKGNFGCPTVIESMIIVDKGTSGYEFMYDQSAEKLVMFQSATHTHSLFINQASTVDAATTRLNVDTAAGLSSQATDRSITGVADTSGLGGVVNVAAAALAQPSAVAIAAQTIEVEVIGW